MLRGLLRDEPSIRVRLTTSNYFWNFIHKPADKIIIWFILIYCILFLKTSTNLNNVLQTFCSHSKSPSQHLKNLVLKKPSDHNSNPTISNKSPRRINSNLSQKNSSTSSLREVKEPARNPPSQKIKTKHMSTLFAPLDILISPRATPGYLAHFIFMSRPPALSGPPGHYQLIHLTYATFPPPARLFSLALLWVESVTTARPEIGPSSRRWPAFFVPGVGRACVANYFHVALPRGVGRQKWNGVRGERSAMIAR